MRKISAILLFLSLISITLRSEANTEYLFDKHSSSIHFDRHQTNEPATLAQAQGLKEAQIQGIYLILKYGYSNGITIEYKPYLLLKDGSVYKNLNSSPMDLDVAKSKQTESKEWGTWKIKGKTLSIQWNDGKSNSWDDNWFKAFAAKKGDSLNGNYKSLSIGGNTAIGGDVMTAAFNNIVFLPNGQFSQEKGAGASTSNIATSSQNSANGTYQLNNYTIEFRYGDGKVVRKMFYFYPDEGEKTDETVGIGNSSFVKRKP